MRCVGGGEGVAPMMRGAPGTKARAPALSDAREAWRSNPPCCATFARLAGTLVDSFSEALLGL